MIKLTRNNWSRGVEEIPGLRQREHIRIVAGDWTFHHTPKDAISLGRLYGSDVIRLNVKHSQTQHYHKNKYSQTRVFTCMCSSVYKYIQCKVWKKWHLKTSTEFRKIWILLEIKCNLDITDKISYISKGCIVRARSWWVGTLLKRCNICWGLANHYTVITLKRLNIMVRHSLLVLYIYII